MLKASLSILFAGLFFLGNAQWVRQQKPLHKNDFTRIASKKYTMAFEYELSDDQKTLTSVIEYGAMGLPAAFYEKGTNDNGDTINKTETIYKFDGPGRLIRESYKDLLEGESSTIVYTYGKNGKLVQKNSIHIDPTTTSYTYDASGKLTKTYTTVHMPTVGKNGESTGKAADFPNERKTFTYDKAGNLKEEIVYYLRNEDGGKQWSYKTQWAYNSKNQLVKLEHINSDNKIYSIETYEYNTEGLLIKKTSKMDDEPLQNFAYEYCTTCKQSWMK